MYLKNDYNQSFTINKSVFIVYLKRMQTEKEYKDFVAEIKKKHYDANHCCSGFYAKKIQRSNDDKEPAKTAGVPILNAIIKSDMVDLCAIVVRYFGGIKFGASKLTRTYGQITNETIQNAPKIIETNLNNYEINIDYKGGNKIINYLNKNNIANEVTYSENIKINFFHNKDLKQELNDVTSTDLDIKIVGQKIFIKDV